ncbi:MAG: ComEC/Rec2 family competence protein [Actinomycetota bacterium]
MARADHAARAPDPSARLFAIAGAMATGVVLAGIFRPTAVVAIACGAIALVVAMWRRALVVLLVAALAFGFTLAGLRLDSIRRAALAAGAARNADALLTGEVLTTPELGPSGARFVFGVRAAVIDGRPVRVRERAFVTLRPPPSRLPDVGDVLRIDSRLRAVFFRGLDAAGRASARRLVYHGVAARAYASAGDVTDIGRSRNPIDVIARAGQQAVRRVAVRLPEGERGLLLGVTIGDTTQLDPQVDLDFRTTGLTHLLAVSGENVAMVLVVVAVLLRAARAGRRTTIGVMAFCVLSFCAITRFEPSVLRAGAMTAIALVGTGIGARKKALTTLAAATVGLIAYDPFLIYETGFQLSILATIGILVVAPRIAEHLPEGKLAQAAAITLGAQLTVAPLILLQFHQLSLISIGANLVVMPAVAPATVGGMAAAGLGALWRPLARAALITGPPIAWMQWVAHALAQLPLASVGTPSGVLGLFVAVLLAFAAVAAARGKRPRRVAPVALSLALVMTGGVWARALGPAPLHGLVVTMINVGQGDAILVREGAHTMLIDGGPDPSLLLKGLAAQGVHRIDLLVISHPHADHVDGLVPVAATFPIARALDPYTQADLPAYASVVQSLQRRHVPRDRAVAGVTYRLGAATVDVLWPGVERMHDTPADINNNSIVLRVRYGSDSILLAGEVQEEAQQELPAAPSLLRTAVLKVSHHGSAHMLPAFYAATGARVALIPVGPNTFGHPAGQTLAALRGMEILRSDRQGTVSVALDGRGDLSIRTERPVAAAA